MFYIIILFITILLGLHYYKETLSSLKYNNNETIIVSLSTSPKRIFKIESVLQCILKNQTLIPDKIVLNLPYVFKRNNSTFKDPLPSYIINNEKIHINFTEDIGPITKILPTTKLYSDPDAIIISIDDDIWYPPHMIEQLVSVARKYPNAVVTGSASHIGKRTENGIQYVDFIEGFNGVLYRQKHLANFPIEEISKFPRACYLGDDLILSNYLKKHNIPIISAPFTVVPLEYGKEEDALHKSHLTPNFYGHDYNGCVNYLKSQNNYYLNYLF